MNSQNLKKINEQLRKLSAESGLVIVTASQLPNQLAARPHQTNASNPPLVIIDYIDIIESQKPKTKGGHSS